MASWGVGMEWVWCGVVCEGGGRKLFWLMLMRSYGSWQLFVRVEAAFGLWQQLAVLVRVVYVCLSLT